MEILIASGVVDLVVEVVWVGGGGGVGVGGVVGTGVVT